METIEEIDNEIMLLEKELENVVGSKTEVYTRIVGYYRSVDNWNKGKKEEYKQRVCFEIDGNIEDVNICKEDKYKVDNKIDADKYMFFYSKMCIKCVPFKEYFNSNNISNIDFVDVLDNNGYELAVQYNVRETPTVIFLKDNKEVYRCNEFNIFKEKIK